MRYRLVLILGLLFCSWCYAQQQDTPLNYDDTTLEKQTISDKDLNTYKADKDFDYTETKKEDSFIDKAVRWLQDILRQFWEAIFGIGTATGFLYFVFRVLPYILLGVLVFLLVRFFLKVNSNNLVGKQQAAAQVNYTEEEQIIKNEDINALIQEAINQKNYRLAVRYYYLLSLKHLTESDIIAWQPQKTNEDYVKEINEAEIRLNFTNITRIYDYVWYGEFNIDAQKFEHLKLPFESLNTIVTK
jgi:hypothetical protein